MKVYCFFVAIFGKNFCESGKQAFKLLVNNSLRVTVINSVGDFVLILTKILVVVATLLIGVHMLQVRLQFNLKYDEIDFYHL